MPHGLPEIWLPTTFAFARSANPRKIPNPSLRRVVLESIFVPVASKELMPTSELPMDLFPAMVVLTLFASASIPIK
jgi:hypothetical protein